MHTGRYTVYIICMPTSTALFYEPPSRCGDTIRIGVNLNVPTTPAPLCASSTSTYILFTFKLPPLATTVLQPSSLLVAGAATCFPAAHRLCHLCPVATWYLTAPPAPTTALSSLALPIPAEACPYHPPFPRVNFLRPIDGAPPSRLGCPSTRHHRWTGHPSKP